MVGPCQDALVLRCDLSGDPSFRDVVRRIRDRALAAHANSDVPFVLLSAEFGREPGRHPLYQASIVLQQWPSRPRPRGSSLQIGKGKGGCWVATIVSGLLSTELAGAS